MHTIESNMPTLVYIYIYTLYANTHEKTNKWCCTQRFYHGRFDPVDFPKGLELLLPELRLPVFQALAGLMESCYVQWFQPGPWKSGPIRNFSTLPRKLMKIGEMMQIWLAFFGWVWLDHHLLLVRKKSCQASHQVSCGFGSGLGRFERFVLIIG